MNKEITIVAIREQGDLLSFDTASFPMITVLNLPIVKEKKKLAENEWALMSSFASTPGRYLEAAVAKIKGSLKSDVFLLNPLIELSQELMLHLFLELSSVDRAFVTQVSSLNDIPLGIFLKPETLDDLYFFRFLSCVSASLDATLLQSCLGQLKEVILRCEATFSTQTEFFTSSYLTNYKLVTSRYTRALKEKEFDRVAYFPHHAGDLLFFLIALQETQYNLEAKHNFNTLVINSRYKDLVLKRFPSIKIIEVQDPLPCFAPPHDLIDQKAYLTDDLLYFYKYGYPLLPEKAAYYYFRGARRHDDSEFHLIDQLKFSLTNEPFSLVPENSSSFSFPVSADVPKSVLLHFDGGWDLKVYPEEAQTKLIDLLKDEGFKITILSDRVSKFQNKERVVKFTNLQSFEDLLKEHAILVGMDSFPSHYATLAMKHPTITLFSSTSIKQASAPLSDRYAALCQGKSCSPCHRLSVCPIYQTKFCHNFVTPKEVIDSVKKMYDTIYSKEIP